MIEVLRRSINNVKYEKTIKRIRITSVIFHQQFVDYTMLYGKCTTEEEKVYKIILNQYSSVSSQEINLDKS